MKIVSILLTEVAATPGMYIRPFRPEWHDGIENTLLEATNEGRNLSPAALSTVANDLLRPAADTSLQAQIANGFNNNRMAVTMVVEVENMGGRVTHELVTGYTDFVGVGDAGGRTSYAPEMRFFFDGVSNLIYNAGFGMEGYGSYQLSNSTQILTPLQGWHKNDQVPAVMSQMVTTRPKDVLADLSKGAMSGSSVQLSHQIGVPVLANTTYNFTTRPKRNSRVNNIPSEFLSRSLTGYRDAMLSADTDDRSMPASGLASASESPYINEPLSAASHVLTLLGRRTGYKQDWSVTWKELLSIDPTIASRTTPIRMNQAYKDTSAALLHGAAGWDGANFEHQVAQLATSILPASMVRFALGHIHFIAHAETIDGSCDVQILNMYGAASGIDPKPLLGMIKQHLAFDVFQQLSKNGRLRLYIEAKVFINGVSTITVSINGGPKTPFMVPSYCGAVYSPCLAPNETALHAVSNAVAQLGATIASSALTSGPGILYPQGSSPRPLTYAQATPSVAVPGQPQVATAPMTTSNSGLGF